MSTVSKDRAEEEHGQVEQQTGDILEEMVGGTGYGVLSHQFAISPSLPLEASSLVNLILGHQFLSYKL